MTLPYNTPSPHGGPIGREAIGALCVFETHAEVLAVRRYLAHIFPDGEPGWVPTPVSRQGAPWIAKEAQP